MSEDTKDQPSTLPENTLPLKSLEPLVDFNDRVGVTFQYSGTSMEIRSTSVYSPLDDCQAVIFGLWEVNGPDKIPIGIVCGIPHQDSLIVGSRIVLNDSLRQKGDFRSPISEQFKNLDTIHPPEQSGSTDAFELIPKWHDGKLSQIFLGVTQEVLARHNVNTITFNDDKTMQKGSSVYTRHATGESQTGRQNTTTISTKLSEGHRQLVAQYFS